MKVYSTERWFLYRANPFRPLYEGGLGFQLPPAPQERSSFSKRERGRWHLWEFADKKLATSLALGMNKASPDDRVFVAERADFSRFHRNAPTPLKASKKKLPRGLAALA